jgi:hypothetical protein
MICSCIGRMRIRIHLSQKRIGPNIEKSSSFEGAEDFSFILCYEVLIGGLKLIIHFSYKHLNQDRANSLYVRIQE